LKEGAHVVVEKSGAGRKEHSRAASLADSFNPKIRSRNGVFGFATKVFSQAAERRSGLNLSTTPSTVSGTPLRRAHARRQNERLARATATPSETVVIVNTQK
jgi:hypothetical protein